MNMIIPKYIDVDFIENKIKLFSNLDKTTIIIQGSKNISDFKEIYYNKNLNINNKELINKLKDNHMLIDKESFQKLVNKIKNNIYNSANVIQLIPIITQDCNFRCIYCYEKHIKNVMSEDILNGMVEYVKSEIASNKIKFVVLSWFGGEPLLYKDLIIKYTTKIGEICDKNNITFISNITTNGYLLDEETLKNLLKAGIYRYQITLDGTEHDKKRIYENGSPTYNIIINNLKNIKKLSKEEYPFKLIIRRNILNNENLEWYDEIGKELGGDNRFEVLVRRVFPTTRKADEDIIEDINYLQKHQDYASKYFTNLDTHLQKNYNQISNSFCYAAIPKGFTILPDGSIQKCSCTNFVDEWTKVGKVIPNKGFKIDEEKNKQWLMAGEITEQCLECDRLLGCLNSSCPRMYMDPATKNRKITCNRFGKGFE